MSIKENKNQWDDLGRVDPFWAMTGTKKFGAWDLEAFLQTGEQQVAQVMRDAKQYGYPQKYESALDFGCGVGRLARAFQTHFERYVGLDISDSLILKAREINASLPNAVFEVSTSGTLNLPNASCDLVYSWAVFQHIANREFVYRLLSEFLRVLSKGGLLIFSAMDDIKLLYRLQPRRRLYAILRGVGIPGDILYRRLKLYPQEVHYIPQQQITAHLTAVGAKILEVKSDASPKAPHQVRVYYVTK